MSDMCGKWKLESRDENFESFLTCQGVKGKADIISVISPKETKFLK